MSEQLQKVNFPDGFSPFVLLQAPAELNPELDRLDDLRARLVGVIERLRTLEADAAEQYRRYASRLDAFAIQRKQAEQALACLES